MARATRRQEHGQVEITTGVEPAGLTWGETKPQAEWQADAADGESVYYAALAGRGPTARFVARLQRRDGRSGCATGLRDATERSR